MTSFVSTRPESFLSEVAETESRLVRLTGPSGLKIRPLWLYRRVPQDVREAAWEAELASLRKKQVWPQ